MYLTAVGCLGLSQVQPITKMANSSSLTTLETLIYSLDRGYKGGTQVDTIGEAAATSPLGRHEGRSQDT